MQTDSKLQPTAVLKRSPTGWDGGLCLINHPGLPHTNHSLRMPPGLTRWELFPMISAISGETTSWRRLEIGAEHQNGVYVLAFPPPSSGLGDAG